MLADSGLYLLILSTLCAFVLMLLPMAGYFSGRQTWMRSARPLAYTLFALSLATFAVLVVLFVLQDFSVTYVWRNSNSLLPLRYRVSAVWGGHEGSILMWVTIQCLWIALVARFSQSLSLSQVARVLSVLGLVALGFLAFVLFTSNPFDRTFPVPQDGFDLNPLLQDIGLILHPPLLYMGYVGLSVAFALSIAALIGGRIDEHWIRWSHRWTNLAWAFLTVGLVLGSWWAYYELGWGGWWFWDPVENAAFLPWLAGTALIHVQAVSQRKNAFRGWTVLLAIVAFSLSVLGTFLVRSGVLTSVHSFAADPGRGLFVLALLGVFTGGGLSLYALRAGRLKSTQSIELASRETLMLLNSLIFSVAAFAILLGTLFPLIFEAFGKKISVGAPYFGLVFYLLMAPAVFLLPFGAMMRWHRDAFRPLLRPMGLMALLALALTALLWWVFKPLHIKAIFGLLGASWLLFTALRAMATQRGRFTAAVIGMHMAHLGVAVFVFGVSMTEHTDVEKDLLMQPGQTETVHGIEMRFTGVQQVERENYRADQGAFDLRYPNGDAITLHPQKRYYPRQQKPMTEAAIDPRLTQDVYISLGNPIGDDGGWSVRIYIKPFIRWMWFGGLMMLLGALIAVADRSHRRVDRTRLDELMQQTVPVK